jgi:uncharacterized protein (DUF2249 family)
MYDKYIQKGKKMNIISKHDMLSIANELTDIIMEQFDVEQLDDMLESLAKDKKKDS